MVCVCIILVCVLVCVVYVYVRRVCFMCYTPYLLYVCMCVHVCVSACMCMCAECLQSSTKLTSIVLGFPVFDMAELAEFVSAS